MVNSSQCVMNKNEMCNFLKRKQRIVIENVYCPTERSTVQPNCWEREWHWEGQKKEMNVTEMRQKQDGGGPGGNIWKHGHVLCGGGCLGCIGVYICQ